MESAGFSSQEKLDELLHIGKITDEDYRRLSIAMNPPGKHASDTPAATVDRRLRKNWENGMWGGLLAGYARYSGADAVSVRILFLISFLFLCMLNGMGLLIIPLYVALCAQVPWDDEEKAQASRATGRPRLFMAAIAALLFVLPAVYAIAVFPSLESSYQRMGIEVWSPSFQETLAGRAVDSLSEYQYWLNSQHTKLLPAPVWAVGLAALSTGLLGGIYATFCREKPRRLFARTLIGLAVLWVLFLAGATLYPLATHVA